MDPLQTIPTDRPPPFDPATKRDVLDEAIQEHIADLVSAVETRLEQKIGAFIISVTQQIDTMNGNLSAIATNTKAMVESSEVLKGMGTALLQAHQDNLSLARELGIIWSEKERARLESERG